MEGSIVKCLVNFITGEAYEYDANGKSKKVDVPADAQIDAMRDEFNEAVASADDALMEKFFEGEAFTHEETLKGLCAGVADGSISPVFAVAGLTCMGADQLLNALAWIAPNS